MEKLASKAGAPLYLSHRMVGVSRACPLVNTAYRYKKLWTASGAFELAPLDNVSLFNGACKWFHSYGSMSQQHRDVLLQWMHRLYGGVLAGVEPASFEDAVYLMDEDKACGEPYNHLYGPKKGDVLKKVPIEDLIQDFWSYRQVAKATLKDELRVVGKDARVFVPANIAMILVGNHLFAAQNEALYNRHNDMPIKVGMSAPGGEAYTFWKSLSLLKGEFHQFDGAQNDCHFSPDLALLIREFRKHYLPENCAKMVDRYYDLTYRFLCHVDSGLYEFIGQQTGHTNTAADNSLGYLFLLMYHALLNDLTFEQFMENKYAIVGDDVLLCDYTEKFRPSLMDKTWNRLGMYLESPAEHESFYDLMFMGMHPVKVNLFGFDDILYAYKLDKMLNSVNYCRKSATVAERLQKLVVLAILIFAHRKEFLELRELIYKYVHDQQTKLNSVDLQMVGLLTDRYLYQVITRFEPVR